jgi:HSP20 family protein
MDGEFDDLVRRTWGAKPSRGTSSGFVPPVEILHRGQDIQVRLELPGIDPEQDVQVLVEDGRLIISGERREERESSDGLLVRELRYGSFRREFALPDGVSAEQVSATYDAGLLQVAVRGVVKPVPEPQRVPIQTGRNGQASKHSQEQVSIET